jgi:heptose I phosphotransferase
MTKQPHITWQHAIDREMFSRHGMKSFGDFMDCPDGTLVCHKRGRSVVRLQIDGRAFYLKRNRWHAIEFWKSLSHLRWPQLGARREWDNILAMQAVGIPTVTPVAVSERSFFGVETGSFTMTEELYGAISLEKIIQSQWFMPLSKEVLAKKRRLILKVAEIAKRLHKAGLWHQDFYLGHFLLGEDETLYLIDVQRVQSAKIVPRRYLIKDIGQLAYSARGVGGITRSDQLRFLLAYLGIDHISVRERHLIRRIEIKVQKIATHTVKLLAKRRRRGEVA